MTPHHSRGQALPLIGFAIASILGCAALSVDVGTWRYQQRLQQSAADSAAMAAALELAYSTAPADLQAAARKDASLNSFTNNGTTVQVTAWNPPVSGNYRGINNAVEVHVTANAPGFFSKFFGTFGSIDARAVAISNPPTRDCVVALDPGTGFGGSSSQLEIENASLDEPKCNILSNGNLVIGNTTTTAASIGYDTNLSENGVTKFLEAQPQSLTQNVQDPCPTIPGCASIKQNPPATSPCTYGSPGSNYTPPSTNGGSLITLYPGVYCGSAIDVGNATVTFISGLYVFNVGTIEFGDSTLNGNGVTMYVPPSPPGEGESTTADMGNATINLTPPTSGYGAGILYYQDPKNTGGVVFGNAGTSTGGIYAPGASIDIGNNISEWMLVVGWDVELGNATFNAPDASFPGMQSAVLAE